MPFEADLGAESGGGQDRAVEGTEDALVRWEEAGFESPDVVAFGFALRSGLARGGRREEESAPSSLRACSERCIDETR